MKREAGKTYHWTMKVSSSRPTWLQTQRMPRLLEAVDGVGRLPSVNVVGETSFWLDGLRWNPRSSPSPGMNRPCFEADACLCRLSRSFCSSLAASPDLPIGVASFMTVSASLSSSCEMPAKVANEAVLRSLMLRRDWWKG